ncbi:MAG: hypothetical protein R3F43_25310 [bacterium]
MRRASPVTGGPTSGAPGQAGWGVCAEGEQVCGAAARFGPAGARCRRPTRAATGADDD